MNLDPTESELARRDQVHASVLEAIRTSTTIKLPAFDPDLDRPGQIALVSIGIEPNPFSGTVGIYRYQLEGEEDLLHLIVVRQDGEELTPAEGQAVAGFVWPGVPSALIWLKPGVLSQHFYVGHDELVSKSD